MQTRTNNFTRPYINFHVTSDTMGYAFTFPVVAWLTRASVPIGAYVHYPTISTDMLARVQGESWKMRAKRL